MEDDEKDLQQLKANYAEIVREHSSADASGEIRAKLKELDKRWESLTNTVNETIKNVNSTKHSFLFQSPLFFLAEIHAKCAW